MSLSIDLPWTHAALAGLVGQQSREVNVTDSHVLYLDETWEGGSRRTYSIRELANPSNVVRVERAPWPKPPTSYTLQPGQFAVVARMFRGKVLPLMVVFHPDDYAARVAGHCTENGAIHEDCRACPELRAACAKETTPAFDVRAATILAVYRGYKSSYRQGELQRMGVTAAELDALVASGHLSRNRAGATSLTVEGRTLASRVSRF